MEFGILWKNGLSQRKGLSKDQRAIDQAGRRIDELVYELYGLTKEEIAVIEH